MRFHLACGYGLNNGTAFTVGMYAVGILLCPAAGLKSCGNTGLDRTFQPGRGIFLG